MSPRLVISASRGYKRKDDENANQTFLADIHGNTLMETVFIEKKSEIVADTASYPDWEKYAGSGHGRSWMGIPLVAAEKCWVCSLWIRTNQAFSVKNTAAWLGLWPRRLP